MDAGTPGRAAVRARAAKPRLDAGIGLIALLLLLFVGQLVWVLGTRVDPASADPAAAATRGAATVGQPVDGAAAGR